MEVNSPEVVSVCDACEGRGVHERNRYRNPVSGKATGHLRLCETCNGQGIYFDNPEGPSDIMPGPAKVALLAARYSQGVHLWRTDDKGYRPGPFEDSAAYLPTHDMAAAVAAEKAINQE